MQDSIDDSARVSPAERTCDWAFRLALLLLIVVAPWPFGSVTPGPAAALTAALLLLGGAFLLTRIYFGRAYRTPGWHWLAAALALVALQQMPLPSSFSETTAPAIARDYEAARTVTGSGAWHPMSLEPFQTRSSFLQLAGFLAAFWLASQLFRGGPERRVLVYTLAFLGVALALFAVFQKARYGTVLYGRFPVPWRCCTARSKSLTSLCRLQSHPAQYVSGIPSAAILLSISHPIRCSTRCLANVRARISGPMIAL